MLCASPQGRFGDEGSAVEAAEAGRFDPWTVHPEAVMNTQQRLCGARASGGRSSDDATRAVGAVVCSTDVKSATGGDRPSVGDCARGRLVSGVELEAALLDGERIARAAPPGIYLMRGRLSASRRNASSLKRPQPGEVDPDYV